MIIPRADANPGTAEASIFYEASVDIDALAHSEYSCDFPTVEGDDPAVAVVLVEERTDGRRESRQWFFAHADTRTGARYAISSGFSGGVELPSIAAGEPPQGTLFSASDFVGPTKVRLLWAAWHATVRCSWSIEGNTIQAESLSSDSALLFSQAAFKSGVAVDAASGGVGVGAGLAAELVRHSVGRQIAFLYDGGQDGLIRSQVATVEIKSPTGDVIGNKGQDPWLLIHSSLLGDWHYVLNASLGSTGALWLFSLPD